MISFLALSQIQKKALNLPDNAVILGIFAAYAGSQRPLIAQTYNSYSTLRVMASYQNTAYVVRVLYKIEA